MCYMRRILLDITRYASLGGFERLQKRLGGSGGRQAALKGIGSQRHWRDLGSQKLAYVSRKMQLGHKTHQLHNVFLKIVINKLVRSNNLSRVVIYGSFLKVQTQMCDK